MHYIDVKKYEYFFIRNWFARFCCATYVYNYICYYISCISYHIYYINKVKEHRDGSKKDLSLTYPCVQHHEKWLKDYI